MTIELPAKMSALSADRGLYRPKTAAERGKARTATEELAIAALQDLSLSPSTRRAYESDLRQFQKWLADYEDHETPDWSIVATYATHPVSEAQVLDYLYYKSRAATKDGKARYSPTTMTRWVAAINWVHEKHEEPSPGRSKKVRDLLKGIRRQNRRPPRRADPLMLDSLRSMLLGLDLTSFPGGVKATRDAAVLVFGFAGATRRSEAAALTLGDVKLHPADGIHLRIESSKTDQAGRGAVLALPYGANSATCAPCAFVRWYRVRAAAAVGRPALMATLRMQNMAIHVCQQPLAFSLPTGVEIAASLPDGLPLFPAMARGGVIRDNAMSGAAISDLIKLRGKEIGLDTTFLSGHSPRSGFVTEAFRAGATPTEIMRQGRWTSAAMLDVYQREYNPLEGNAVTKLAL